MVAAQHPVKVRAQWLVERSEQNFIQALYEDLKTEEGRLRLNGLAVTRLKQPVHRAQNILVADICCQRYGFPRVDPRRVVSAGVVVRRIVLDEKGGRMKPERLEGWLTEDRKLLRGWAEFSNPADLEVDPDPRFRRAPLVSGHAEINRRLIALAGAHFRLAETSRPAFVAPPAVCEAAGRTFLYGVVPVTSLEAAEVPPDLQYSEEEMLTGYSTLLTEGPERVVSTAAMPDFVRQLAAEYGIFGTAADEKALLKLLNELVIPDDGRKAGDFVQAAYAQIFNQAPSGQAACVWPAISAAMARRLRNAVFAIKRMRLAKFTPHTGRFESRNGWYRARMFIRARDTTQCPPRLYWGDYTEAFQIAPWYEHAGAPVRIAMPDLNRDTVKSLQPNVAFDLPPGLFNLLAKNSPDSFLKGEASEGGTGLGIAWLCSFSLPIITLCAFIVLNLFLQLLNIVFWWLPFIKICIPIPVPKKKSP